MSVVVSVGGGGRLGARRKGLGSGGVPRAAARRPRGLGEGQDAERKLSYSREKVLVTAGAYSEGILSPAWDAREKKKNPAFSHPGVQAISGTPETACFASSTNPTSQEGKYKSISHLPSLHVQFYYQ